jgi:hypothetical protein
MWRLDRKGWLVCTRLVLRSGKDSHRQPTLKKAVGRHPPCSAQPGNYQQMFACTGWPSLIYKPLTACHVVQESRSQGFACSYEAHRLMSAIHWCQGGRRSLGLNPREDNSN